MRININESGISFNRDSGSSAVLDESILKEIEERLQNINDKVEYSDKIPTDEDIVIWINPEDELQQEYLIRINDETIASNTVWSSEKVNEVINEIFIQADSHIHLNKDALDKITENDINRWNNKSDFNGSYKSLTDKPYIPSIEGLASEEYVDEAIENLQLPSNLATIEDIPTHVSELENDSEFITKTELEDKNYLIYDDVTHFALKEEVPTKISELENDSDFAKLTDLHGHNNKDVIDSITEEKIAQWENHFSGDYNDLKNKPKNLITQGELESKGYITEADVEGLNKVVSSDTEPTNSNIILWINTSQSQSTEIVARIKDDLVNKETTWSSEKISNSMLEKYNDLLARYNELLRRIIILEGGNPDDIPSNPDINPDNPPTVGEDYLQDIEGYYLQDLEGYYLTPLESDNSDDNDDGSTNPPSTPPIVEEYYLQDIEGYYLQDLEGYYLIPLESDNNDNDESTEEDYLQDIEGYYLQDSEGYYLIPLESGDSSSPIVPPEGSITDYYYLQDKEGKYLQGKDGNYLVVRMNK